MLLATFLLLSMLAGSGTASRRAAPACRSDQYDLLLSFGRSQNDVLALVGISTGATSSCALATTVRVTLRHADGSLMRVVRGNPGSWTFGKQLEPWTLVAHAFAWRNWCRGRGRFVLTAGAMGREVRSRIRKPPACRNRRSASRLVARTLPRAPGAIPAHVLPAGTPFPFSPSLIRITSGWLVSNGRTLVAVYAGEAGDDPSLGRFGIVRQNLVFGVQTETIVDVGKIGSIHITDAPEGAAVETSAQHGDVGFSSATGTRGVLHLGRDTFDLLDQTSDVRPLRW
jgi:hypothetical protein